MVACHRAAPALTFALAWLAFSPSASNLTVAREATPLWTLDTHG
jgi:hypothetical protein